MEYLPINLIKLDMDIGTAPKKVCIDINNLPQKLKYFTMNFSNSNPASEKYPIMISPIYNILQNCTYHILKDINGPRFTRLDIEIPSTTIKTNNNDLICKILDSR